MKKLKTVKAYSITNAVIHGDIQYSRWEPDNITTFRKTLTTKKEPTIWKIQTRILHMNESDRWT